MTELVLATRNEGKVAEIRTLLVDLPLALISASEVTGAPEADEPFDTLEENAIRKARVLHEFTGKPAVADDTGLEVTALGGRPGVHSARYAGVQADPSANRRKLLAELAGASERSARFRTVVAFVDGASVRTFEGVCRGTIDHAERGEGGFGYDALFIPEGGVRTFAEMSLEEKNRLSHRGEALRAFAEYLRTRLNTPQP